ncbi:MULTISPECIES: hypothetical protein [Marinitoga]|uniref:Uncharacterized protein n=1 Tax=Marinitoga hydrogenitolerans (strain DSM 16785 / JCM 12826 / AT1271) TaxID=1122195 RepID=A0A1M4YGT8_MARH1|nr:MULTISPECIES: hypothetical protein [Marinitoga]KLO22463.1 hypothetical protein X274_08165 [Marinitoga sp. 1155]SHF04951.1 hypothetical protein SAMN02745164_01668 [Marinitoga hydrogenitolerans DSM 16785]
MSNYGKYYKKNYNKRIKSYYEGFDEMENIKDILIELKRFNY